MDRPAFGDITYGETTNNMNSSIFAWVYARWYKLGRLVMLTYGCCVHKNLNGNDLSSFCIGGAPSAVMEKNLELQFIETRYHSPSYYTVPNAYGYIEGGNISFYRFTMALTGVMEYRGNITYIS